MKDMETKCSALHSARRLLARWAGFHGAPVGGQMNIAAAVAAMIPAADLTRVADDVVGVEEAQVADQEPTPLTVEHWKLVTDWVPEQ